MKRISLVAIFIAALFLTAKITNASLANVEGKSAVIADNPEKTKEKAVENGLRQAVELYVEGSITKPGVIANYEKLEPAVFSIYKDFVNQYEITDETKDAQWLKVKMKVDLNDKKLQGALAAIGIKAGSGLKPKVMVMASEKNVDDAWIYPFYWELELNVCEGVISNALLSDGFQLVASADPARSQKYKATTESYVKALDTIPNATVAKMAKDLDREAELVVSCSAVASNLGKKSAHFNTLTGNATCKVVNIKTNSVLGHARGKGTQPHVDPIAGGTEAISKACEDAASQLRELLSKQYR